MAGLMMLVGAVMSMLTPTAYDAAAVTADEMSDMRAWMTKHLASAVETQPGQTAPDVAGGAELPFSFGYGSKPFAELRRGWKAEYGSRRLDDARTEHAYTWRDPKTGLFIRCAAVEYADFPVVEWTLHFKNEGSVDTPILADIRALDTMFERGGEGEFLLHHAVGSPSNGDDYAPIETPLGPKATRRISAAGGRPTNSDLSYFNLQWPHQGVIVVVGWPGQWAAEFARDEGKGLRVRAGQEVTHFKLLPGEEVRSPLTVLQFWRGEYIRSQNIWRRWMIAHNLPRPGGRLPPPQFVSSSARATREMVNANEENQIMHIDRWVEEKFQLDYWWMDAGWYVNKTGWPDVGTWEVDTKRFPRGLRAVSDHARSRGMKTIVWFEPERVTPGTWLYENHPEWLLGSDGKQKLLNLGNPDARKWLTDHIDRLLTEQGIDLYRQDFNMDPLEYWRATDVPDRVGITENRHVTGYLAYWDELRRRHPEMLIDTCASGGRRNDLETLRRAVPLWRSDHPYEPASQQSMTMGISLWIPYQGTATVACSNATYYGSGWTPVEPYAFWSNVAPSLGLPIDIRERNLDYDALRRLVSQWRRISECYYGDFYPLTSCNRLPEVWAAWQFDRPDLGRGFVQAFRRADSPYESARFRLGGLDPNAKYVLTDLDADQPREVIGRELTETGLLIEATKQPAAAVIIYHKVP
ncbi:MAG TPA: alpha-galactosidase [Phycisphaerae bacterium]|nr:alpha-galactosidase [Phycisphaerae bacterium]